MAKTEWKGVAVIVLAETEWIEKTFSSMRYRKYGVLVQPQQAYEKKGQKQHKERTISTDPKQRECLVFAVKHLIVLQGIRDCLENVEKFLHPKLRKFL